jgi:subtilisin family serine protease
MHQPADPRDPSEFPVEHDLVGVRFHHRVGTGRRAKVARAAMLQDRSLALELPDQQFTIYSLAHDEQPRRRRHARALASLGAAPEVARVAPVFAFGRVHGLATDRLAIEARDPDLVVRRLRARGWTVVERDEHELLVELPPATDPIRAAREVARWKMVRQAEPDLTLIGRHWPHGTGGAGGSKLALGQYAVGLVRAAGAWRLVGSRAGEVTIAVVDGGVDGRHPDLISCYAGGYDATSCQPHQRPHRWDWHGTACAGIAVGTHHGRAGVKGIATGSRLLAIRIGYQPSADAPWISNHSWIRRGIDWAWRNGAEVLSLSWGGGPPAAVVTRAIERARVRGRGGLGSVIVVAAGNIAGPVQFPGTLPQVLTVAASNQYDEPKTLDSRDGDRSWGSNFGPEVDLAAPGVAIYSTTIPVRNRGFYTDAFDGTSAATPIVAAAAAQVLAANPRLTERRVRDILKATADRVGWLPYQGGRNDHMGHGRVNVLRAVRRAGTVR